MKGGEPLQGWKIGLLAILLLACVLVYVLWDTPAAPVMADAPAEDAEAMVGEVSGPLSGVNIVVDPGHGGYDQGCETADGVFEAPLNLEVSLRLREVLERYGAYVSMTRETDDSLVDPDAAGNRKKQDMALRQQVAEDAQAQIFISVHMNYYSNSRYSGAQTFYRQENPEGIALAKAIQASFQALDPGNQRVASSGDFFVLGICEAATLVECGFLSNPAEKAKLLTAEYQQQVAEAIADGIVAYWHEIL